LKLHRSVINLKLTEIVKERNEYSTLAYFLHSDPFSFKGGTEVHVMDLVKGILQFSNKYEIFVFFPEANDKDSTISMRYFNNEEKYNLDIWFYDHQFISLLSYFAKRIDFIHVHHFLGWDNKVLDWLRSVEVKQKILTLHDFRAFCVNPNLVFTDGKYCTLKTNIHECQKCFEKTNTENRRRNLEFLLSMDKILVPSGNTKAIIHQLADTDGLKNKITVFPHFLPFAHFKDDYDIENKLNENLVVFLGGASDVKGILQFLEARQIFERQGFKCEIWGHSSQFTVNVKTQPYKGYTDLAGRENRPYVVFLPSVWPETFSYTLFEALFILRAPVVVGPYGNPAEFVKKHNVGIVMNGVGANFLIDALEEIKKDYSLFRGNVFTTIKSLAPEYQVGQYIERYFRLFCTSD
jgi:glycosyltransferase involved in cell wall biosynthesis